MILSALGPLTAYRMHTPKWAAAPTSGAGAATHGGRANRPGIPALYLALEPQTAIREYQQLPPLMPPGTLAAGAKGILFASTREPEGLNLALYTAALTASDVLQVYDPTGALPKNQDSWR